MIWGKKKITFFVVVMLVSTLIIIPKISSINEDDEPIKKSISQTKGNTINESFSNNSQNNSNLDNEQNESKFTYQFLDEIYLGGMPLFSPLEEINVIVSDDDFVWFGTNGGLVKYNKEKNNWIVFDASDGLSGNRVLSLAILDSIVWIGTSGGLCKYSIFKNEIKKVTINGNYEQSIINSIAVDENNLWLGHSNTVSRYDFKEDTWEIYSFDWKYPSGYRSKRLLLPGRVYDIYIDDNDIWIVSSYGGIQKYSISSDKWMNFTEKEELTSMSYYSINGYNNNIWFGGYGILKYSKDNNIWTSLNKSHGLQSDYLNDLEIDSDYLWMTMHNGISKYKISNGSIVNYNESNGFIDCEINTVEIEEEYVWFGFDYGIIRYKKSSDNWTYYSTFNELSNNCINSIFIENDNVWFGTNYWISKFSKSSNEIISHYGISFTNKTGYYYYPNISDNSVWYNYPEWINFEIFSICGDEESIFFSFDGGLMQYSKSSNSWSIIGGNDFGSQCPIYAVVLDNDLIWGGVDGYISSYNKTSKYIQYYDYSSGWLGNVEQMVVDNDDIWFSTMDGLWRYSKSKDEMYEYLSDEWIISVAVDNDFIWAGTAYGEIKRYSKSIKKWSNLKTGLEYEYEGMYNFVNSIIIKNEVVWFGTEEGLIRYNKTTKQIKIYNESNGLIPRNINTMVLDGDTLWMGNYYGVIKFNTESEKLLSFYDFGKTSEKLPDNFTNDDTDNKSELKDYFLKIGPIQDEDRNPVKDAKVTIIINDIEYTNNTNDDGNVIIHLPLKPPEKKYNGVVLKKGYKDMNFNFTISYDYYHIKEPIPELIKEEKKELKPINYPLYVIIFVSIVLIFIGLVLKIKKKENKII